ncbi:DNA-binding GntR family transcriptional regulator [Roseibium hamelinense]|uniref:DNA-binding GntR family transcriptional regulator n=1 Tax=Roseibium hamelinense TaxID=150831 RepID=A0A562T1G0_9HYPH|nr:GntR family transcriptional regulator [Roseibium hamelinense]MTI44538.1 GntR family transcriptional regulator [Roseibium hamelinense]TWI87507.1 DNA-binding GntR family transcriptional regulator [Roseibium hamelinense]
MQSDLAHSPANTSEHATQDRSAERGTARAQVDQAIRAGLLIGRFIPGKSVTLRGLAKDLGVSPMPVREVIQRLAAEKALEVKPNGRVQVPEMSPSRFDEILRTRLLLEPELAGIAMKQITPRLLRELKEIDLKVDESLTLGDPEAYLRLNHLFHFKLYEASKSEIMLPLVKSLWLQFAPFMRTVYGRVGTVNLVDRHKEALAAILEKNVTALKSAIAADISDGMGIIGRENLSDGS